MTGPLEPSLFIPLFLVAVFVALLARKLQVPYAVVLVVAGLVIGATHLLPSARLDPHVLLTLFLPPLLFKTALLLKFDDLKRHLKPIALYTFGASLLSAVLIAAGAAWILSIPIRIAFVFGALIAATDPIAVIAIFQRLGAPAQLTLIIEAESLFNDGIAAVLFLVAKQGAIGHHASFATIVLTFAYLLFGGMVVGALVGFLASLFHKQVDDHLLELMLTTIVAFGSYLIADRIHTSGVISVVVAGLIVGNLGSEAMSEITKEAVYAFWEYAEFVVNSLVFLLMGAELALLHWLSFWRIAIIAFVLVVLARLCIYPLSLLLRYLKAPVPLNWQHILWWGGLRGALSMALVLSLPHSFLFHNYLIAMTFGTVTLSILVQGLTISPLLHRVLMQ